MKRYITTAVVTIYTGLIELTEAQAAARYSMVEKTDEPGIYSIKKPVQFKVGEHFGYDADLPKSVASSLEPEKSEAPAEGATALHAPRTTRKKKQAE